jgi:hypothetical protein
LKRSIYSFGEDSPIKFEISDKLAKYYNQAAAKWFKAQQRFNQQHNRKWNPRKKAIDPRWNRDQQKAWDDFAEIFDEVISERGTGYHPNDIMGDFLVKNVVSAVTTAPREWGWGLTLSVASGVLYGLLRRM